MSGFVNIGAMDNWRPVRTVERADIAVTTAVKGLGALNAATKRVLVTVEDAPVVIRFDGGTPSASAGHGFVVGTVLGLSREMAGLIRVIRQGSTNGRLAVTECEFANGARM